MLVLVAGECSGDGGQQVRRGDDAIKVAIFVVDHGHAGARLLQRAQRVHGIELVRHDFRLVDEIGQQHRAARQAPRQNLAHLDHAQHLVGRAIGHRQQRVRRLRDHTHDLRLVIAGIDPVQFGPRGHQFTYRLAGQLHDTGQDRALLLLDHAAAGGIGKDHVQLLAGETMLALVAHTQQPQDRGRAAIQQPYKGGGHPRQHGHRQCHHQRDRHGRAQGQLLGHQFAYHQAEVCGQHDHHDIAGVVRPVGRHAKQFQPFAHRAAQRGARDRARDDPDQGDADLHCGEELARLCRQLQRHFRALAAVLGGNAQLRGAGRNNRQL